MGALRHGRCLRISPILQKWLDSAADGVQFQLTENHPRFDGPDEGPMRAERVIRSCRIRVQKGRVRWIVIGLLEGGWCSGGAMRREGLVVGGVGRMRGMERVGILLGTQPRARGPGIVVGRIPGPGRLRRRQVRSRVEPRHPASRRERRKGKIPSSKPGGPPNARACRPRVRWRPGGFRKAGSRVVSRPIGWHPVARGEGRWRPVRAARWRRGRGSRGARTPGWRKWRRRKAHILGVAVAGEEGPAGGQSRPDIAVIRRRVHMKQLVGDLSQDLVDPAQLGRRRRRCRVAGRGPGHSRGGAWPGWLSRCRAGRGSSLGTGTGAGGRARPHGREGVI
ncbi:hypothetical protein H696_00635 [Fonticula alba]|uniref:Uncharacterized protein n=1 Tax=Fonticula alba TaxID=691883 RepID=A0A058ZFC9_FONAL|nr:hypothetical protein H696_00635 [Fonticula alba]KCV73090.1 hypothetical protein H696_00635 [Fonticula alba]|eukprot:XP_009492791.1 hypothetical protein H696_00635 [Fonticula alba]